MDGCLVDVRRCPDCGGALNDATDGASLRCAGCARDYPRRGPWVELIGARSALNLSEIETQDRVSDHYENARYQRPYSRAYHLHTLEELLEAAPPRGRVLDDGCGNGFFLEVLSRRAPDAELHGIDMLELASRRLGPSARLARADACRLPFADASFDVVYARGLLHHLPDPAAGAREAARVLKPGGTLVTLDPHRNVLSDLPRRLANKTSHFDEDHKSFTAKELRELLAQALEVTSIRFTGYVAYPLMGFPDLIDFGKVLPLEWLRPRLLQLDAALSHAPLVSALGWGLIGCGRKR
jgi:SAM-dependent methyltransferase